MYEGGIRIPLIIHAPGSQQGEAMSTEPVYVADIYPTLVELTGLTDAVLKGDVSKKEPPDGMSLVPIMRDPSAKLPREALYFHFPHYYPTTTPASAIRMRDWKLVEYHEGPRQELFNLKDDPTESTDLSAKDPVKTKELLAQLDAWRKEINAPMPKSNRVIDRERIGRVGLPKEISEVAKERQRRRTRGHSRWFPK